MGILRRCIIMAWLTCPVGCAAPDGRTASVRPGQRVDNPASAVPLRPARQQRELNRQLVVAAFKADADEVKRLLVAGAWGDTRFGGAEGDGDALSYPNGGRHVSARKWSPLHAAAMARGDVDRARVARLLLDAGADPDADDGYGATPLYMAASENHEELALLLIERGAEVNTSTHVYIDAAEGTPLHAAAEHGNAKLIRALLAAGADLEARDTYKFTPLHDAVGARSVECARLLIEAGADVSAGGGFDRNITPLMTACNLPGRWSGRRREGDTNVEMVRLLIDAGADVNARADVQDPFEPAEVGVRTPLLVAARAEDLPAVRVLVAAGADVRVADEEGETPLHMVAGGHDDLSMIEEGVRLLLEAGSDPAAKDKEGKTALDVGPYVFSYDPPEKAAAKRRVIALLDPTRPPRRRPTTAPSQPAAPAPTRP